MLKKESLSAMAAFAQSAREEFDTFVDGINQADYERAAAVILDSRAKGGRLHITGIGKPSHICGYGASLLSSTGTPCYLLHGTEAVHGSCGQLAAGDVVICVSNSGETAELKATVTAVKNNDCRVIAISGNSGSWLAGQAEAHLFAGVGKEGGPLNRAPRVSILAETFVIQALSVLLQAERGLTPQEYVRWHPGGTLGQLRSDEQ